MSNITVEMPRTEVQDITVYIMDDGEIWDCNHAGAKEGTITRYAGDDAEWEQWAMLCDKCDAWCDRDGDWN